MSPLKFSDIDFVIVGAAKSATTWLQTQLQADPDVHMPDPELHYFSREHAHGDDWYLSQFAPTPLTRLIGEKSNSYLDTPEAAARLHAALPHARLVVMLRDPVQRAYSDYCMLLRRGEVSADIERYLDPRVAGAGRFLTTSRYDVHLNRLLEHYDREAIHVAQYEDVATNPQHVMDSVRRHLGLEPRALAPKSQGRVKDKRSAVVSPGLRKVLGPLKPWVAPLRGSRTFEAARSVISRQPDYPTLSDDLHTRMIEHFRVTETELQRLGITR